MPIWIAWALGGSAAVFLGGFWAGYDVANSYGSSARAYAAIVRELDDTNAKIRSQKADDEAAFKRESDIANKAFDDASAQLLKVSRSCPASKEVASIINGAR